MKIIITEEQKKKLFIPRKLSSDDSRYSDWNNEQPIKNGKRINQYDNEGNKTGYWEEYWDGSTKLYSKGNYKKGNQDGMWEYYGLDGDLWIKGNFKNNKEDGVWEDYVNNKLKAKFLYDKGRLIQKIPITESEQPKKKLFIPRKLSDNDSRYTELNNNQPIVDGKRINQYDLEGRRQGYWEYYQDGKLYSKGNYINGEREGYWETYHSNGQLEGKGNYVNGKRNGICEYYWVNGNLWIKDNYVNDRRDGACEYYNKDGSLNRREFFKNGKLINSDLPITESEQPKKKLFIPRKLSDEDSRYSEWNKQQPSIVINDQTVDLNQYSLDGKKIGIWVENPTLIKKNYDKTKLDMETIFNNLKLVKPNNIITNYYYQNKFIFQINRDKNITFFDLYFWREFKNKHSLKYKNYSDVRDLIRLWIEIKNQPITESNKLFIPRKIEDRFQIGTNNNQQ